MIKCIHHWVIGEAVQSDGHGDGNYEPGTCKKCGATKRFRESAKYSSVRTGHWGMLYNGWSDKEYDAYVQSGRWGRIGSKPNGVAKGQQTGRRT